jgi:hypothetical protein
VKLSGSTNRQIKSMEVNPNCTEVLLSDASVNEFTSTQEKIF